MIAPRSAILRKPGQSYDWPVTLRRASGGRWRYRGPCGWFGPIADTPAAAWSTLLARMPEWDVVP